MKKTIEIVKATVLLGTGPDRISLSTTMPCPYTKKGAPEQQPLFLDFSATAGHGIEYVRENFGVEPEVIDRRA